MIRSKSSRQSIDFLLDLVVILRDRAQTRHRPRQGLTELLAGLRIQVHHALQHTQYVYARRRAVKQFWSDVLTQLTERYMLIEKKGSAIKDLKMRHL